MSDLTQNDIVLGNLVRAASLLREIEHIEKFMPEVRMNLVFALPDATDPQDVAGIEGRITLVGGRAVASGYPAFGASSHMARAILAIRRYDPRIRAGLNFRWEREMVPFVRDFAERKGLFMRGVDRTEEPELNARTEGMSIPWKIEQIVSAGRVPDIFYEGEGWGKEPLFVIVGEDAVNVVHRFHELVRWLETRGYIR